MSQFNFNECCEELLVRHTRRDGQRVANRLQTICDQLRKDGYRAVQTMLGGSVKKGTYVSGLSDVDALLIVNRTPFANKPPSKALKHVCDTVQLLFQNNPVKRGRLAVTVNFADGMEIQAFAGATHQIRRHKDRRIR